MPNQSKSVSVFPKVSIILPTFNRANLIIKAIESVLNQTYQNFELIIVDNHSTDNTNEIVNSFKDKRIKYFKYNNKNIIAKSRNYGIKKSIGKYIAFLDSDDWWKKNKLEISILHLEKGYDLTYHKLSISYASRKTFIKRNIYSWQIKKPIFKNFINYGNPIASSSVVIKKSLINQINGFSEDKKLMGAEDFDAWIKCSYFSNSFKYINKTLGYYLIGDDNSSNIKTALSNIFYLKSKYLIRIKIFNKEFPYLMKYQLSSIYFRKKNFKVSFLLSRQIIFHPFRFSIFIKTFLIYIISLTRYKFRI